MNKFVKIEFYNTVWSDDWKTLKVISEAKRSLVKLDCIVTISPTPLHAQCLNNKIDLYYVKTNIASGRGINGVDYAGYYVTEDSCKKLMTLVEAV